MFVIRESVLVYAHKIHIEAKSRRNDIRVCDNPKCNAHGRIVYSVATRCPLCKWDLKPQLPASEIKMSKEVSRAMTAS